MEVSRAAKLEACKQGKYDDALRVITAAAQDLENRGEPLWHPAHLTSNLFSRATDETVLTGYLGGLPVTALILTFHDPQFWPEVAPRTSSFVHKLSVSPAYQGRGLAAQLLEYAATETRSRGISVTRLDCPAERPKLCTFYESLGYERVDERNVGDLPTAFYVKHL